jgi:hypothetical protein
MTSEADRAAISTAAEAFYVRHGFTRLPLETPTLALDLVYVRHGFTRLPLETPTLALDLVQGTRDRDHRMTGARMRGGRFAQPRQPRLNPPREEPAA